MFACAAAIPSSQTKRDTEIIWGSVGDWENVDGSNAEDLKKEISATSKGNK